MFLSAQLRRPLMAGAALLTLAASLHARPLTDAETATLQGIRGDDTARYAARSLAVTLGAQGELDVLPALLPLSDESSLIANFFRGYDASDHAGQPAEALETLVTGIVTDPQFLGAQLPRPGGAVWNLLHLATRLPSRPAWQTSYAVIRQAYIDSAQDPALRRRIDWHLAQIAVPDEPPDLGEPLAALLPWMHDGCQGQVVLAYLRQHPYPPALEPLRGLYERSVDVGACVSDVLQAIAAVQTREATQDLAQRLRTLTARIPQDQRQLAEVRARIDALGVRPHNAQENAQLAAWQAQARQANRETIDRDQVRVIMTALRTRRAQAQIDLDALARDVLANPVNGSLRMELVGAFGLAAEDARRAREFTEDNLFYWVQHNNAAMVQSFVEQGVRLNGVGRASRSLVCQAIARNAHEVFAVLVRGGASVSRPESDPQACVPLSELARVDPRPPWKVLRDAALLLAHGARLDERDAIGNTPLHQAALSNNQPMLSWLVSHGADVNARRPDGATVLPLIESHRQGWLRGVHASLYSGPQPAEIHGAAAELTRSEALVRWLIDKGLDVTIGMTDGVSQVSPIILAHEAHDTAMEDLLRSHGAVLNPLRLAMRSATRGLHDRLGRLIPAPP